MGPVDFESNANEVLINPRMPAQQAQRLRNWLAAADDLTAHVFVLTSGSTDDFKWVALSKRAVLAAAEGAITHLAGTRGMGEARATLKEAPSSDTGFAHGTTPENESGLTHRTVAKPDPDTGFAHATDTSGASDVWLHCLPDFHVGGLGIWARAYLSGARVVRYAADKWNPKKFAEVAAKSEVTLCSLVPTQVHDLVEAGLKAPPALRAIIVGGAALPEPTYFEARELGWPLLPSYGMTEAASQVATADVRSLANPTEFPSLTVLPHLEVGTSREDGRIRIRGASLLTGIVKPDASGKAIFFDPKDADGWLTTDDFGQLGPEGLTVLGRIQDRVKIGGELANLTALRRILDEGAVPLELAGVVALVAMSDPRLESVIVLVAENSAQENRLTQLSAAFDARVMPFERIREIRRVAEIPRTELGKIRWSELSARVQEQ